MKYLFHITKPANCPMAFTFSRSARMERKDFNHFYPIQCSGRVRFSPLRIDIQKALEKRDSDLVGSLINSLKVNLFILSFMLTLLLGHGGLSAQYPSLLDSQKEWIGSAYEFHQIAERTIAVDHLLPQELTIADETYVRMFSEAGNWYNAYLREDTASGKVWVRYTHYYTEEWVSDTIELLFSNEILLFDFALEEGDAFVLELCSLTYESNIPDFDYPTIPMIVTEANYIDNRKVITLQPDTNIASYFNQNSGYPISFPWYLLYNNSFADFDQLVTGVSKYQFIEGIGSNYGFFFPHVAWEGVAYAEYFLHCVLKGDSLIWHNPAVLSECNSYPINIALSTSDYAISEKGALRVVPNPASQHFRIGLPEGMEPMQQVELCDMQGRMLRTWPATQSPYPVDGLPAGMYVVRANGREGVYTQKLILER